MNDNVIDKMEILPIRDLRDVVNLVNIHASVSNDNFYKIENIMSKLKKNVNTSIVIGIFSFCAVTIAAIEHKKLSNRVKALENQKGE